MPPKRRALGRSTRRARRKRTLRASESEDQRALRLENLRVHAVETRSSESSEQLEVRLETDGIRTEYSGPEGCKCSNKHRSIKTNTAR
ncbi:hypothetical protein EVAR_42482_1 [Eumeta japonica]|uniref:Uncharacterized protein n=1 Tax=Eumeta variegata TaxID=151549 RepID=A0A4C1XZN3_EUMVA|nr:hypothetical protein EVAR_42482_1 [Eumeta japonica]